ncbi:DUF2905 domain-containing protein [Pedobacter sp. SYSU D00535]|uniref:DUF2905 domain-containing protein n=1 Tax=Pedobacter sp. SYSU D00535 TaxID=2810308 RepID=UPI001A977FFE|nr:DUF2905 domain-containing protein [Pedobacter sp. SYSU D00535]
MNSEIGKWLIVAGGLILFAGLVVYFFHNKLHWIGNLPGDIRIERNNFKFYFPITTMILVSLLINLVLKIVRWFN